MEQVLAVEDRFYIIGLPGVTVAARKSGKPLELSIGEMVVLVRPDGTNIEARVNHLTFFSPPNSEVEGVTFSELAKEDVPIGTVIYRRTEKKP